MPAQSPAWATRRIRVRQLGASARTANASPRPSTAPPRSIPMPIAAARAGNTARESAGSGVPGLPNGGSGSSQTRPASETPGVQAAPLQKRNACRPAGSAYQPGGASAGGCSACAGAEPRPGPATEAVTARSDAVLEDEVAQQQADPGTDESDQPSELAFRVALGMADEAEDDP